MAKRAAHSAPSDLPIDSAEELPPRKSRMERLLDAVERVGNRVPHPVVIFVMLIGILILFSHVFYLFGAAVSFETIDPETEELVSNTVTAQSLLTADGFRFMFTGVVDNFMSFTAVGVIIVAMLGIGVAEEAGLVRALIHKLVLVAPRKAMTYILVFIGILSSVAAVLAVGLYRFASPRFIARCAFLVTTVALALLAAVIRNDWGTGMIISGMVLAGLGEGALVALLFNVLVSASPKEL